MTDTLVFDDADQQVFRCRFESSEGWILERGERLSPNWRFTARCSDGEIVVRDSQTGVVSRRIDGCKPAWRPRIGNRLTWVRDGAVYERGRPLLSADDLRAAARRHPNLAFTDEDLRMEVHVRALAWMDVDHLAASLGIRAERSAPEFLLVVFEGRKVVVAATNFRTTPSRFVATRTGSLLAGDDGTIVTAEGNVVDPPDEISEPRDVSFSPDERWLAWATGHSVYLVGTPRNNEPGKIIRLPIPAQDLGWGLVSQATQVGPPIRRGRKRRRRRRRPARWAPYRCVPTGRRRSGRDPVRGRCRPRHAGARSLRSRR